MRKIMTVGLLALPVSALAINTEPAGFYAGTGLSQIEFSGSSDEDPDWTALELSGGYKHSPYVGVETRLGFGSSPDLMYGGLYYRTESANETAKTYLLLGFGGANIEAESGDDFSLSGISYGAGIGFPVARNLNFNLEYRVLVDDSGEDVSLNALTASLDYRFSGGGDFPGFGFGDTKAEGQGFYAGLGVAKIDLKIDEPSFEGDSDIEDDFGDDEDFDEGDEEDIEEGGDWDPSWNAIELIGGYSHGPLATVELRLGTTDNGGTGYFDHTLNYVSLYYRPAVDFGKAQLYGLFGYSSVNNKTKETDDETGEVFKDDEKMSGLSYGVGGAYSITENLNIGLEYRLLVSKDFSEEDYLDPDDEELQKYEVTWEYTAFSANINYRF
ncbi:MAG TPA: outer membrane beta-barrel protein [Cellvibrio sp.]|nr:outer membrane beta-barrel protein [Cellvibrio sp.]